MMTNSQLATASLNDIVFDGRNKRYGAYELRAIYQRHVTRALAIAVTMCALLLVFPVVAKMLEGPAPVVIPKIDKENILIAPPLTDEVVVPPPPPAANPPVQPPQPSTVKDVPMVVVKETELTNPEDVPNRDELLTKASGLTTTEGDPNASPETGPVNLEPGLEKGPMTEVVKEKIYISVEQMPQLPEGGGTAAIVAAIQRAARYPSKALSNGIEGRVFVSFTVNAQGEVVDAKVLKGLGYGLDEETLRAINTLPKFIPGKQNGREVSVSFSVPISFKIQ